MFAGINLSYSFILFFGGLSLVCMLLLYKSIQMNKNGTHHLLGSEYHHLYSWHTPNLKKWKLLLYTTLYWVRDISFRYWAVHLLSFIKLQMYKLLRNIHKRLLGAIKFLERHEDQLKHRLAERPPESRSATEQRLIRTLSQKKYPTKPINARE